MAAADYMRVTATLRTFSPSPRRPRPLLSGRFLAPRGLLGSSSSRLFANVRLKSRCSPVCHEHRGRLSVVAMAAAEGLFSVFPVLF